MRGAALLATGQWPSPSMTGQSKLRPYLAIMRTLIALLLTALPASAWEFTPNPICTLDHTDADVTVKLTFDHSTGLYAIAVTHPNGWPNAPVYSIRFDGPRPLTISTNRHQTQGTTITATDTGFSNVLNGLQYNTTATSFTATAAASFSLDGAAAPVEAFRSCTLAPSV